MALYIYFKNKFRSLCQRTSKIFMFKISTNHNRIDQLNIPGRYGTQSQPKYTKMKQRRYEITIQNESSLTIVYNFLACQMKCGRIGLPMIIFVHHLMS